MRSKARNRVLLAMFIGTFFIYQIASANTRDIYIGDIIQFEIKSDALSSLELDEALVDFEVINIVENNGSYQVSLRTFEPGQKKIVLGDAELIIDVKSTLENTEREDIHEVMMSPQNIETPSISFAIAYVVIIGITAVSGISLLVIKLTGKKKKGYEETPYQRFLATTQKIQGDYNQLLGDWTEATKMYLSRAYGVQAVGKTTAETLAMLEQVDTLKQVKGLLGTWMNKCDRFKYRNTVPTLEEMENLQQELRVIFQQTQERVG